MIGAITAHAPHQPNNQQAIEGLARSLDQHTDENLAMQVHI